MSVLRTLLFYTMFLCYKDLTASSPSGFAATPLKAFFKCCEENPVECALIFATFCPSLVRQARFGVAWFDKLTTSHCIALHRLKGEVSKINFLLKLL